MSFPTMLNPINLSALKHLFHFFDSRHLAEAKKGKESYRRSKSGYYSRASRLSFGVIMLLSFVGFSLYELRET